MIERVACGHGGGHLQHQLFPLALPGRKSSLKSLVAFAGALGKLGKQLAGLRWLHPAGGAHEQRGAKLLLQRADGDAAKK